MSKRNDDFFHEKKPWSIYKDKLLGCYLVPYYQKILHSGRPLLFVDCFAGQGKFDDGKPGSPLIEMECLRKAKANAKSSIVSTEHIFIELDHYMALEDNLQESHPCGRYTVIGGKFEDNIPKVLEESKNHNLFVYFDPYGIKALNMKTFLRMKNRNSYHCTTELLINFNSFGLYRNCCKVMNYEEKEQALAGLTEYDPSNINSVAGINAVFGTDLWQNIISKRRFGKIDAFEAEYELTKLFCDELHGPNGEYKYVLQMPIRASTDAQPKYRMIFATSHADGCLIMAENMFKRSEESRDERSGGQLSLFEQGVEETPVVIENVERDLLNLIPSNTFRHLNDIFIDFYQTYGVMVSRKTLVDALKRFHQAKKTEERRNPPYNQKGESRFYEEKGFKKTLEIRRLV